MGWIKVLQEESDNVIGAVWQRADGMPGFGISDWHVLEPEREPEYADYRTKAEAVSAMRFVMGRREHEATQWVTVDVVERDGQRYYVLWNWTEDLLGRGYAVVVGQYRTRDEAMIEGAKYAGSRVE
jgi:hypothetical protein